MQTKPYQTQSFLPCADSKDMRVATARPFFEESGVSGRSFTLLPSARAEIAALVCVGAALEIESTSKRENIENGFIGRSEGRCNTGFLP